MGHSDYALVAWSTVLAVAIYAVLIDSQSLAWACVFAFGISAVGIAAHWLYLAWNEWKERRELERR